MAEISRITADQWANAWRKNARLPEPVRLEMLRRVVETYRMRLEEAHRISGYPCTITIEVHKE